MITSLEQLLEGLKNKPPKSVALAQAADEDVLLAANEAVKHGIASFKLMAEPARLMPIAEKLGLDWVRGNIVEAENDADAARKAIHAVHSGQADLLMKGHLHTGTFLKAVLDKETGLRGPGILSQCGVYNNPLNRKLLLITDCAMNIAPDIMQKKQILENAVALIRKLGVERPKVAVLTALEIVNVEMQETIDAAVLSKMADRGQIKNCIVDGPLALDNALSAEAAKSKGFSSPVSGDLDVLLVPDLKTGNALHKSINYFTPIKNAAMCLGARVPIVMTSRTDHIEGKAYSIALACYTA